MEFTFVKCPKKFLHFQMKIFLHFRRICFQGSQKNLIFCGIWYFCDKLDTWYFRDMSINCEAAKNFSRENIWRKSTLDCYWLLITVLWFSLQTRICVILILQYHILKLWMCLFAKILQITLLLKYYKNSKILILDPKIILERQTAKLQN